MSNKGAPDILKQIVASKELRVECRKKEVPLSELESRNRNAKRPLNFSGSLMGVSVRIIAEIKRDKVRGMIPVYGAKRGLFQNPRHTNGNGSASEQVTWYPPLIQ